MAQTLLSVRRLGNWQIEKRIGSDLVSELRYILI